MLVWVKPLFLLVLGGTTTMIQSAVHDRLRCDCKTCTGWRKWLRDVQKFNKEQARKRQ